LEILFKSTPKTKINPEPTHITLTDPSIELKKKLRDKNMEIKVDLKLSLPIQSFGGSRCIVPVVMNLCTIWE
jgi:hypothetical protein